MADKKTYSITTSDGKTHDVSIDNINKYGIGAYANAYKDATIHMRDKQGADYDIPLQHYQSAMAQGLQPFESVVAEQPSQPQQAKPTEAAQPQAAPRKLVEAQSTAQQSTQPNQQPTAAPQPTWQPTEQEKIRIAYNLNSIVSDFNKRSRARVEQARRVAERNTPEGRKKLKAAKFQAQLAGTPTQVLGLTPDVSPAPTNGQEGRATGDQPKPLLSGQSPVPYGVVEVDGQRKTQWLLPDGTLTTDFAEADKAEYGARRVRLMNQFVGRMKGNGLDPSKQEDVQRQAQLDYEAPIRKAVAAAIEADDERSQQEQEAYMSEPLNMIGGVNAALGHAAARKEAGIGDLNLIAEKAYESLPTGYRRELVASYTDYFTKHPEATNGKTIDQAAQDAAKSVVYSQVHETYVGRNAPKSATEFFVRKMLELNPSSVALSSTINPYGQAYAELDAMERYGAEHRALDIAGTVAGMAIDPTTYLSAGVGNWAFKRATRLIGKAMAKKAVGDVAGRYATTTLAGRLIGGIAAGGANFGTFEATKDAERQIYQGGYQNPETGEMEGFSFGSVLNSGVHGVGMGAATGVVSPLIGNVADKVVKATSSTAGKVAMRGGEQLLSTVAEGTIFSIPEWINGEQDAFDVWTDNMAMMAGFKLSHAVKTAPAMIRSLRPVKPTGDRPLTRDERTHNNKSFAERVRERMDASASDIALTNDEREELRSKGYGELSDLFSFDPEHKSRKAQQAQSTEGDYVGVKGLSRVVDYEPQADERGNRDFDGYEAMERLMEDNSVSEATRAKAYYILTGRHLPMSTVTGWTMDNDEDGNITVSSLSHQGGVVTSRRFKSNEEAQREIDRINRQAELNTIDIGEQYRNAEAQERVMAAAIHEISPGADPQTVYNIYEAVRRGDKNVTEEQRAMADMIDEAIERNSMAGDEVSPEGIRRRISEGTGVDVDKVIRKEPEKRTEAEQEAVRKYARALFPEEEAYEPTPEEAEADRVYEDSRLLYGRFEQGDPEAPAEIDAISLRMEEAHQLCEDAFGDEAEVYMSQIKENPWGVLADPNLTSDQRDAVLYYINANAALDGVLDASNEAAADKRQKVQEEVAHRTHKERGVIVPATMKLDDRPTYIIKGDVAMFPDGSGVDVRNSSDAIIILDEQGEYKFVSPDQIMSVGETIDPQTELQTAYESIDREQEAIFTSFTEAQDIDKNTEAESPGDKPADTDENILPANVEEYDRGYEEGTEVAMSLADDILNGAIEDLRSRDDLSDEWRGRLEAYEYEQQRRQTEGTGAIAEAPGLDKNISMNEPEANAGTGTGDEPEAGRALDKVPVSEETGDPLLTHESVDAETAWDAAMEFFGTPEDALNYVESEISNAKTAISAAEKGVTKVKPTGGMTKYRDDLAKARAQVETSKSTLTKWEAIAEVQKRRKAEETARKAAERAERDAQLHDEAVARFEEEQRIKAQKQAEQEAIGTHAVNPKIREKWTAAPKVDGHLDIITLPDGSTLTGHYVMTEAQAASASHDPESGFEPTEGFPIDANGQSVNDRDYKRDKDAQRIVQSMADAYDSRAMQTPVIVSKDGIVLSGNNRTMSGDIAAAQGTDGAYLEYLNKYGRKFGFTPEQVGGMKHPRVVFVPDDDLPYDANTFSRFNAQEMKSQSKPEAAIKLGKIVDDAVFNRIVADLNRYDRMGDFYADQEAAARTLGKLVAAGAINDKQLPELRTGTALSAAGKELIENALIGKTFQTEPDAVRMIISSPTLRQGVILGLGEIANNRTLADKGYDLSKELSAAVDLVFRAKSSAPDIYKDGMPVSPFGRMQGLFDDEYGESRVTDATTLLLADLLNSGKPSDVRKVLSMYNQSAKESASGVVDIFSETGKPDTKEEILTRVNEHFRNATPKEQQALVDAAIEQRKRDAEAAAAEQAGRGEASNEAEPTDERGGEPEQPALERESPTEPERDYTPEEEALLARVEVTENDWEEEGKKPNEPIYKREIIIDGKHSLTQVDAPDEKGTYSGPYFEYDGKRFGFIGDVADYIDKQPTAGTEAEEKPITGLDGYSRQEVRDIVSREVEQILSDADIDAEIVGIEIHGSRGRGDARPDSDLDIVLEYRGDVKEYAMFNAINETPIEIEGIQVDVNPIRAEETGTLADYMKKSKAYDEEKLKSSSASVETTLGDKIAEAEATVNTTPTEAQKEAGNYKKGHVNVEGFDVTIEQPKGSIRRGKDAAGNPWESKMNNTYGYIRGTEGVDGDHIDVFLSDNPEEGNVYVVDQYEPDGTFDEHKVMYGFADSEAARSAYLSNYEKGWENTRRIDVTGVSKEDFKKWIQSSRRKTKPFADYKSVNKADNSTTERPEMPAHMKDSANPSGNGYTITPSTYTNKKNKTSDVWHVKFDRDLTPEEKAALNTFIQEPLEAGRKTSRGWLDRKNGIYIMRSEEAARELAAMIGNEEAVADAQPLSEEDYQAATNLPKSEISEQKPETSVQESSTSEQKPGISSPAKKKKKATPKPKNQATLQEIAEDGGENKLAEARLMDKNSDSETPVAADGLADRAGDGAQGEQKGQFKVDDEMRSMEDELRSLLGIDDSEGDRGDLFRNPEDFTNKERMQITSLGITYALKYFDQGIISFPEFADKMVRRMGEKIRPWLKSFYGGARDIPGYDHLPFTPADEVKAFDVMNFDKANKEADLMRTAQGIVAEQRAGEAVAKGQQLIKEQRNQTRKENEKQTAADTDAIAAEAEAIASQAEAAAESAKDEREIAAASEKVDEALDKINEQLALLGYYEADPVDKDFNEAYGYMRNAEKKALADAVKLAKQLVGDLGIEIGKVSGTPTAKKSKTPTAVRANIAPAGGDITIRLPLKEGRELMLSINLDPSKDRGDVTYSGDNLQVTSIMYRVENPNASGYDRYGRNCWANADATYRELLSAVERETYKYLPERTTTPLPEARDNDKKLEAKKQEVKPEQTVGDLFSGLFDEPMNYEKKAELRTGAGTAERKEGHEPRQNESLGTSQRNQDGGTDRRGMAGRGGGDTMPDSGRSSAVSSVLTEHAIAPTLAEARATNKEVHSAPLVRLPEKERRNVRNNRAERGVDYAPKGVDARIKANIKAIELAQSLLESGKQATPEQMAVLRQFSGWGGLGKAFSDEGYSMQIKKLLGEAYQDAVDSRKSAYYTPAYVIDAMWDIARAMGFKGGNVLEGSAGIGNIIGLMPEDMSERSAIHAVEVDRTTGGILSLLYPDANVDIQGFETIKIPNGSVDLSITNVPFITGWNVADTSGDKDLSRKFRDIHDFCIAKNVRKLKPGGIGIFITSSGTLDNSDKLRAWLTNEGSSDVIGAFRMNNQTFGGTGATSDIIVVRKRINGQKSPHAIDVSEVTGARIADFDTGEVKKEKGKEVPVIKSYPMRYNKYFFEHPENMAGEMMFNFEKGETFQPTSRALFPVKGKDQTSMLKEWSAQFADMDFEEAPESVTYTPAYDSVGNEVKTGSMIVDSQGRLCTNMNGVAVPVMGSTPTGYSKMTPEQKAQVDAERVEKFNKSKIKGRTRQQCLQDYNEIKKALAEVLKYQTENADNEGLEPLLKKLNQTFDHFVSRYGNLHKNTQLAWLRNDVDYPSILALESFEERPNAQGARIKTYGKTDIFSQRVVEKEVAPKPENVKDGIIASIYMSGRIDLPYIAEALGRPAEEVKKEIISSGLGFENPNTTELEVSYEYLSGNVREKLRQAQENNVDGRYNPNIKALERVIPMNIPAHLIEFSLGSSWISPKLYEDFIKERTGVSVRLKNAGGTWFVGTPETGLNTELNRSQGVFSEMFKSTIYGHQLMEAAITNRTITVSRTYKHSDGSSETVTDKDATQACAAKIDEIRQDFKDWARGRMQQDPEMSEEMEHVYNDRFNNYVARDIPEEFIPEHFGGAAHVVNGKPFKLRLHQAKAVIRGTTQSLLLAHEVGTGKTYTLISTAMEMRRLGTARKPMIVVQNATVGQFVESAKALYPNARILTIEEADRTAEGRKNFYAKIKYNDWDMIVVPQSVFERIPDSEERQIKFIQDKIDEKMKVLEDMKEEDPDGKSVVVRQAEAELEKSREELNAITRELEEKRGKKKEKDEKREAQSKHNAEVRAMEMLDRETDDVENFDEMGIDAILVDEAHEYKHLGFSTAMQRGVKGVDPSYSKKAQGVYLKTLAVKERNNGRNVIFATGTPISNTAAEIWTFMRYLLDPDMMKEYGIYYFDDFVRNFGNLQQMLEFTTSGKFKDNNRFAGYVNLPELVRIWSGAADTVLTREAGGVNDKIPRMEGDKAQDIYLPQTRALRSVMLYVKSELDRYENMTGKEKKQNSHIPLVMYGLAKAAAVDARLVVADAEDDPNSKTNEAVRQTLKSLKETESYKGTVAIFADNYQNKKSGFNLYEDIRKKLIEQGVPADQIVVMRSDMTVKKKLDIFESVNRGDIRVIMGSTFTLGTGVNIQERLHTLIHVDAPNRPMDYTQRNGRILRQGNLHKEMGLPVRVLRFGVEDSLDVTAYQRLKTKGAIADSIMNGKELISNAMENRSMEEDEDVFGDITAQLSGSEYAMLKNQAEKEVRKYTSKLKQWEAQQTHIHNQLPRLKGQIKAAEERRKEAQKYLEVIGTDRDNKITIGATTYPNMDAMADLFTEHNKKVKAAQDEVREGSGERTMTMNVNVGGIDFTINTRVSRKIANNGQLSFESERNMTYSCNALGMENVPVSGSRLKAAIEDIVGNVMNGDLFRERIDTADNSIMRMSNEVAQLESQKGKPFEHVKELEEAEARLEEYTEKMKAELAAKEAKYAEIDATVEVAEDIAFTSEDEEEETSQETKLYREMEAAEEIQALEPIEVIPNNMTKAELRAVYNSLPSVMKDGKEIEFYHSAFKKIFKEGGLFGQVVPVLDDVLEQSVLAYSEEDKLGGTVRPDGTVHKDHPNIENVDNYIGKVNIEGKEYYVRTTVINQKGNSGTHSFFVSNIDVYEKTADLDSSPGYPRATDSNGTETVNGLSEPNFPSGERDQQRIVDTKLQQFFERAKVQRDKKEMEGAVKRLSERLHSPIRLISQQEAEAEGYRRKKGWYDRDTGAITIVADNHRNVGDIVDTAVHETVGHNGLRQLFETEEKLNNFLDEAYNISSDKIRQEIDRRTERMMDAEVERLQEQKRREHEERGENPESEYYADMAKARIEAEEKREQIRRDATEEYAADLGMKIGEEGFERMDAEELTFWGKMKGLLQKALDRLLAGLKLPKMRRWTDKEWSYVLWKSWRNLREGNNRYQGPLAEAEDITRRERSNFGADESRLFRDADMGLEEAITKMKADAAAANSADFAAKQAAMKAIGGNLSKLRQAMARQREYDITTVKAMTDLSRTLLEAGLLEDLSKYETKRILSAIKNAVGKQDTSKQVQTLMDIMVDNQLRMGANYFGKLLSVKGSHVDARGIEVQGELDPDGQKIAQVVRRSTTRTLDDIENQMSEALNRMGSTDQAVADEATLEYAGLQIAHQYVEEIRESKNEERELRKSIDDYKAERKAEAEDAKRSIEQARAHKDAGRMSEQDFITLEHDTEEEERSRWEAFKQYAEATNDAIRQNKIDRAEAYRSLSERLGGVLGESVSRAKAWREGQKQRVEEIHHNANSDMEGRPTNEHHKADRVQKLVNNGALRFLLAPLGTFDQMLRMFGRKSVRGEGYLWNRYMRGWVDCTEKEYTGYQEALKELDRKVEEVFAEAHPKNKNLIGTGIKSWGKLFALERRLPKATVRFWDGGEMRDHELTQGNLLYIYMTDKMTDGRMKLRRMGITEDDVERIKDFVDPRFIELADWMQDEFLVGKRHKYNAVHKRMFGTSMAAIENYFPLKILSNARMENVDVADDTGDNILPATSTGSIIKRKRNNLALDVTGADAFSVILDHIQQMERWGAFAEYNRDLNTLLSYKHFRNQVMNMTSAYGAGKTLWTNFRNVAAMAAGAYRPPIAPLDKAAVNIAKGVTAAKVSFRVFTALKQFLSMPAYLSDSNPMYLAANIANPLGAWKWSMENLPLFEKRWKSRMAGDPRLLKSDMDWKMWRSRIVEIAGRVGMSPNAFVDALTVAIGARSMYQTKLAKYKRQGYPLDAARKRAKQDATILFNQTQQSSEGAFLSTMQVDRSWLSVLFTVFRNSSMSYTRQLYDAMRNIGHRLKPGYKGMTEEFMAKQMRRDGIDPDKADQNAKQEYRRGLIRDLMRVGVFGYALQLAWNLGAYLPYLIFGKNADEKEKMWSDVWNHSMFGSVEGLTGGDVMSAAGEMMLNGEGNPEQLTKDMPLASDVMSILRKMDKDYVSAMNDVVDLLVQSGLGVNPQSLTDAAVAVMDYCGEDAQTSRECALLIARIINCPQSQIDKIYFDEIDATGEEASTMTPEEIAERYAEYKLHRNAPLTGWAYGEEGRKKAMDKHRKKAKTTMKERMTSRAADAQTRELLESFEEVADRQKEINKLKKSDREGYRAARKEFRESTDLRRHNRVKRYNHDIKRLTERWLNAKTAAEADSLARAMVRARELMLSDIEGYESNR